MVRYLIYNPKYNKLVYFFGKDLILDISEITFRGAKKRDLLLRRYWRREDDGTYGNEINLVY